MNLASAYHLGQPVFVIWQRCACLPGLVQADVFDFVEFGDRSNEFPIVSVFPLTGI
jgi:hypothetical protein